MSNLTKRLITAGVGIPLLFLLLFTYNGVAVPAVLVVLVVLLLWECSTLLLHKGIATKFFFTGIGGALFLVITFMSQESFMKLFGHLLFWGFYTLLFVVFGGWVAVNNETHESVGSEPGLTSPGRSSTISLRISSTSLPAKILLSVICLLVLVAFCTTLLGLHAYVGTWILVYVLAVAWITDTGAYFAGRAFGKRPLAKRISPSKTIEGAIGGCLLGLVIAFILGFWWVQPELRLSNFGLVFICVLLPICAVLGDLIESVLKRISEAKESGSFLPGHGGLLDRVDSLLIAAPFMFVVSVLFGSST